MKTTAIMTFVTIAFVLSSVCFAAQEFGPPAPYAQKGGFAAGVGYYYYKGTFEDDDGTELPGYLLQNIVFVQGSYGFADGWEGYVRVGMADATAEEVEPDLVPGVDFEGDFRPYFGVGLRGMFLSHLPVPIGPVFQYNYYSTYEEEIVPGVTVEFTDAYDLSVGLGAIIPDPLGLGTLYGGVFGYWAKASGVFDVPAMEFNESYDYQEKGSVGGFFGLGLPLGSGLKLNFEGQYKSEFTASVSLNKAFGVE
jgi:hypothetical protein